MEARITERSNEMSKHIDKMNVEDMIAVFHKNDVSYFTTEMLSYPSLYSETVIKNIEKLSTKVKSLIDNETDTSFQIFMSGCGTSGRIGYLVFKIFGKYFDENTKGHLSYCMAGGIDSLIESKELSEDHPHQGKEDLLKVIDEADETVLIGITCGLSAPYVAGQLINGLSIPNVFPVLIGFNPTTLASQSKLLDEEETFYDIAMKMEKDSQSLCITPIVGPEIITGSTRMKGGTATYLILCSCLLSIISVKHLANPITNLDFMQMFERTINDVYEYSSVTIATLIKRCSPAASSEGRIFYLCTDPTDLMCFYDAAECAPTFGVDRDKVRAFLIEDSISSTNGKLKTGILFSDFIHEFGNNISSNDMIIIVTSDVSIKKHDVLNELTNFLNSNDSIDTIVLDIQMRQTGKFLEFKPLVNLLITKNSINQHLSSLMTRKQQRTSVFVNLIKSSMRQVVLKIICNNTSTGTFILSGKIYGNLMIDVKLSNSKLFKRGLQLIESITKCSTEKSKQNLLKAIYSTDFIGDVIINKTLEENIMNATKCKNVVPIAILLSLLNCTVLDARDRIRKYRTVKNCIENAIESIDSGDK